MLSIWIQLCFQDALLPPTVAPRGATWRTEHLAEQSGCNAASPGGGCLFISRAGLNEEVLVLCAVFSCSELSGKCFWPGQPFPSVQHPWQGCPTLPKWRETRSWVLTSGAGVVAAGSCLERREAGGPEPVWSRQDEPRPGGLLVNVHSRMDVAPRLLGLNRVVCLVT